MFRAIGKFFNMVYIAISAMEDLTLAGKAASNKLLTDQLNEQQITKDDLLKLL